MRITPRVIWKAYQIDRLLPLLLTECRTIENAHLELKWIKDELISQTGDLNMFTKYKGTIRTSKKLVHLCRLRSRHYPLQYILKNQPFGELEILCRPGVLIPRWETEEWCFKLIECFRESRESADSHSSHSSTSSTSSGNLSHIDLCTGTGCIALLLNKHLGFDKSIGIDISPNAVDLARKNYAHNRALLNDDDIGGGGGGHAPMRTEFIQHDVFKSLSDVVDRDSQDTSVCFDIVTSNPPYIHDFVHSRSVKLYEPSLALYGNLEFYENLVNKVVHLTKAFVYELGTLAQAQYVRDRLDPEIWDVGIYKDSAGKVRCVYGYRKHSVVIFKDKELEMLEIFKKFGTLL